MEEKYLRHMAIFSAYAENDREKATDYVMKIIEEKNLNNFYRYRPDENYEIDTIENKQIYLCKPMVYEDKGDCQVKFDEKDIIMHYLEHRPDINITDELITRIKNEMKDNSKWVKLMDTMRNDCLVACCTEKYDNDYMWDNYANNSKGICIEYDLIELLDSVRKNNWSYMPIRYVKDRNNQKDIYLTSKEFNMDKDTVDEAILKYKLSCMTKNVNPYYMEREWRILDETPESLEKSTDKGMLYNFIKPKRIIMGKNIKENEIFYQKVCEYKEKNKDVEVVEYEN